MAFLGIEIPHPTARLLSEIDVPGEREAPSAMHITLLYIGKDVPINTLAEAMKATYTVTSKTKPFTVRTSNVTSFPANPDDGIPIIARVESDALHELRSAVAAAFDKASVEFNKKFPTYRPHVTLSYSKEEPVQEITIPTVEWGAHELVLWGGDEADRRLIITFPFSLEGMNERVANRYLGNDDASGAIP